METPNPIGRPPAMDEDTLRILEGAFADGATDELACFLAQISPSTLYLYQSEHPEFSERKKYLKDQTKFQAKKNIRNAIENGDLDTSKWYAERKMKDEFSQRQEMTGADGERLQVIIKTFEGDNLTDAINANSPQLDTGEAPDTDTQE